MLKTANPAIQLRKMIRAMEVLGAIATAATADPGVEISAADRRENRLAVQVCPQLNLTEAIQTSVSNFRVVGSLSIIYIC